MLYLGQWPLQELMLTVINAKAAIIIIFFILIFNASKLYKS